MSSRLCPDCGQPYADHNDTCAPARRRAEDEHMAQEIVRLLSCYVNQGRPTQLVIDGLAREHRTLQQKITALMLQWLITMAYWSDSQYDPRNQKSVDVAKALLPVLVEQNVVIYRGQDARPEVHLPYI